jgi:hypothetical protein
MTFVVAIPSLSRAELLKKKSLLFLSSNQIPEKLIYIFVIPEEEELYKQTLPDFQGHIVVGVKGLPAQRNFIQSYFNVNTNIFFLDDDVSKWDTKHSKLFHSYSLFDFINFAFQHCIDTKAYIWSIYPTNNEFYSRNSPEISHYIRYCIGAFYGIINRPDFVLDFIVNEKEDVRRTLQYFIKDGIVLRFNRIHFETKYYGNVGGMGNFDSRLQASKNQVISLVRDYGAYGYQVIKKTGMWDFRFKKVGCAVFNCACKHQVKFHPDKIIRIPNKACGSIITIPINKKPNEDEFTVDIYEPVEHSLFQPLYQLLSNIKLGIRRKNHRRGFPQHRCAIFGYTNYRIVLRKGILSGLSLQTKKYPDIYTELKRLATLICPDFDYNAIHLNHNLTCPPHKDDKNVGKSVLVSFGDYTGSLIVVDGIEYKTYCRPIKFNGNALEHYNTEDLVGNKYSIVYYKAYLRPNKVVDIVDTEPELSLEDELQSLNLDDDFDDDNDTLFDED